MRVLATFFIRGRGQILVCYLDDTQVKLGDTINVPLTDGTTEAATVQGIGMVKFSPNATKAQRQQVDLLVDPLKGEVRIESETPDS